MESSLWTAEPIHSAWGVPSTWETILSLSYYYKNCKSDCIQSAFTLEVRSLIVQKAGDQRERPKSQPASFLDHFVSFVILFFSFKLLGCVYW